MVLNPNKALISPEQVLSGFTTLLCSALTTDGDPLAASAKELASFISSTCDNFPVCSFPTLLLHNQKMRKGLALPNNLSLQDTAALNLALQFHCNKADIATAPSTMLRNLSESFTSLIDSRLRSSILALLKQSLKGPSMSGYHARTGESRIVMKLLSSCPISVTAVVTSFRALSMQEGSDNVVPIVFEAIIDMNILGVELVTSTLRAPGTVNGSFSSPRNRIICAEFMLDTPALLQSMMKEARFIVRKTVAVASSIASNLTNAKHSLMHSQSVPNISPSSSRNGDSMPLSSSVASECMPPPPPRKSNTNLAAVAAEQNARADKCANRSSTKNQDDSVTRLNDLTTALERNVPNMVPNEAPLSSSVAGGSDQKQQPRQRMDLKHTSLRRPSLDDKEKHLSSSRKAHTGEGLFKKRLLDATEINGGLSSSKRRRSTSCPSLTKS